MDTSLFQGQESSYSDFIAGPDGEPLEQVNGGQTPYRLYQDPSGNDRVMENAGGTITSVGNYPPYGQATGIASPLQYSGCYTDAYTGLVYDQARWYDPSTGQFLSQDPDLDQTLQPYAYAGDAPPGAWDPTGLKKKKKPHTKWGPEEVKCAQYTLSANLGATWGVRVHFCVHYKLSNRGGVRVWIYKTDQDENYCATNPGAPGWSCDGDPRFSQHWDPRASYEPVQEGPPGFKPGVVQGAEKAQESQRFSFHLGTYEVFAAIAVLDIWVFRTGHTKVHVYSRDTAS